MTTDTQRVDAAPLPGIEDAHTRLILADVHGSRMPLVVEIFPDRLHPHAGWTTTDLVLAFAVTLCCPKMGDRQTSKPGWHARADGEWLPKLDEAKKAFEHPCGRVDNGAFLLVRTAKVAHGAPTLMLDAEDVSATKHGTVHLHDGQTLDMPTFRRKPYRFTLASPAVDGWRRASASATALADFHRLHAFARALEGSPINANLAHTGGVATLVALESVAKGSDDGQVVRKINAALHDKSTPSVNLANAQAAWLIGPDRPWGGTTYRCHMPAALAPLIDAHNPTTQGLLRAARVLWDAFGGQWHNGEPTAHDTLRTLAVLAQARAALAQP